MTVITPTATAAARQMPALTLGHIDAARPEETPAAELT